MKKKARRYSVDFKQEAVRRMAQATTIIGLAKELGIRRKLLYQWRDQLRAGGRAGLERRRGRPPGSKSEIVSPPTPDAAELRIAELDKKPGDKTKNLVTKNLVNLVVNLVTGGKPGDMVNLVTW
jgi:transposase-like protein